MKTGCFKYYTGEMGVAICLYPPVGWSGLRFSNLAPTSRMFYDIKEGRITREEYIQKYKSEILAKLDPKEVYDKFKNNVLLCWEEPNTFCHRRLIAEWLQENLDIEVPEWNAKDEKNITNNNPLF